MMSPLTLEKTTRARLAARTARPAAATPAAPWKPPMALDARGGGERARSDDDGRKSGVARGGALQNDDDNVYRPVGGRARSSAQAKDALPCSPAGDENDKDPRERHLCGSAILCDSRRALWQWRKRDATRAQACADNIDRSCQRHPSCLSRGLPTRLPSLFLAASLAWR